MDNAGSSHFAQQYHLFRERQACKVAIACLISAMIGLYFHLPYAFMAAISSYVIMTVYLDQTFRKGLERIVGPALFGVLGLVLVNIFQFSSFALLAITFGMLLLGGFMSFSNRYAYASLLGSIVGAMIIYQSYTDPHAGKELALYFVLNTGIGVMTAWIVTILIWPIKPTRDFIPVLAHLFTHIGQRFSVQQTSNFDPFAYTQKSLARSQSSLLPKTYERYQQVLDALRSIDMASSHLAKKINRTKRCFNLSLITHTLDQLIHHIQQSFNDFSNAILLPQASALPTQNNLSLFLTNFEKTLIKARKEKTFSTYPIQNVVNLFSLLSEVKIYLNDLQTIATLLCPDNEPSAKTASKTAQVSPKVDSEQILKQAFKFALTIIIMLLLSSRFSFLGGIQAVITVAVIAAQPNLGRSDQRARLRLLGALAGAILGSIFLLISSHIQLFPVFLFLLFIGIYFCDYFSLGDESYAYAALQAGIMLILIMMSFLGPAKSLTIAFDRSLGVISGLILTAVINRLIWPIHPLPALQKKICSFLSEASLFIEHILHPEKQANNVFSTQSTLTLFDPVFTDARQLLNTRTLVRIYEETVLAIINLRYQLVILDQDWKNSLPALPVTMQQDFRLVLEKIQAQLDVLSHSSEHTSEFHCVFIEYLQRLKNFRDTGATLALSDEQLEKYALLTSHIYGCILTVRKISKMHSLRDKK